MDNTSPLSSLSDLALDLRWSWNHAADELWNQLDPELWSFTHNAWLVLQTVSLPTTTELLNVLIRCVAVV